MTRASITEMTSDDRPGKPCAAVDPHYSPAELAERWNLSVDKIRRLFEREPGVLVLAAPEKRNRRRYRTMRIPQSVAERVHRKHSRV